MPTERRMLSYVYDPSCRDLAQFYRDIKHELFDSRWVLLQRDTEPFPCTKGCAALYFCNIELQDLAMIDVDIDCLFKVYRWVVLENESEPRPGIELTNDNSIYAAVFFRTTAAFADRGDGDDAEVFMETVNWIRHIRGFSKILYADMSHNTPEEIIRHLGSSGMTPLPKRMSAACV